MNDNMREKSPSRFVDRVSAVNVHFPQMPEFSYNEETDMYETSEIEKNRYLVLKSFVSEMPLESKVQIGFNDSRRTLFMDSDSFVAYSNSKNAGIRL